MENEARKLDAETLKHTYSLIRDEWAKYLHRRDEAKTQEEHDEAYAKLLALDDVSNKVLKLYCEALKEA